MMCQLLRKVTGSGSLHPADNIDDLSNSGVPITARLIGSPSRPSDVVVLPMK